MKLKNAINFLLYSYFNLTLEDGTDTILETSINKAYRDATQQGAYNAVLTKHCTEKEDGKKCPGNKCTKKENEGCIKKKSEYARKTGTEEIKNAIASLLEMDEESFSKVDFDKWHETICNTLLKTCYKEVNEVDSEEKIFEYGNAQKWINMTLKYICILYKIFHEYRGKNCEFCRTYRKMLKHNERYFHVPVDRYIIESVWNNTEVALPPSGKIKDEDILKKARGKEYSDYNSEKMEPWGRWEKESYKRFQKSLQDAYFLKEDEKPLDWENKSWIEIAKKKRNQKEE